MALGTTRSTINLLGTETIGSRTYTPDSIQHTFNFADGTGSGKAQKVSEAVVTLSSGAAQQIALTSSTTFLDAAGNAITFTKIKEIGFSTMADAIGGTANSGDILIGAAGSADWDTLLNATGTLTLPPNTAVAFVTSDADGWAVSASDIINVDGDGTDGVLIFVKGEGTAA